MGFAPFITLWMYWPAAFLAAVGLILLFLALFRDRSRGRLRCPRCWYDMQGTTPPVRCPECGHTAQTLRELCRTRRRWAVAVAALLLLLPLGAVFGKLHARAMYYAVMPRWALEEDVRHGTMRVRLYSERNPDERGQRVVVTDGGRELIDHQDAIIWLRGYAHDRPVFFDADGDGSFECVIECFSGGAHCCIRAYVINCGAAGKDAAVIADIDARNGMAVVPPPGGKGEWLLNVPDQSFDYWKAPYVASPHVAVYFRLKDGSLRVALDRMDKSAAEADALANKPLEPGSKESEAPVRSELWGTMLDLIFGGHEAEAWIYFDRHWPGGAPGKEAFRKEFLAVLASDPWYQDVVAARAARAAGKPIPPASVGTSGRATEEASKPKG